MSSFAVVARWSGFCRPCGTERPLVLTELGPHGVRAWLAGYDAEDRALSYCCEVCGTVEHVPATEALDLAYDRTLPRWPDLVVPAPWAPVVAAETLEDPVAAQAVVAPLPAQVVPHADVPAARVLTIRTAVPVRRVDATDLLDLLALSA